MPEREFFEDEQQRNQMPETGRIKFPAPGLTPDPLAAPKVAPPLAAPSAPAAGRGYNNLNLQAPAAQNQHQFRGFNTDRAGSGGDPNSVKDGFYRFASGQQGPQDTSKEGLDAWLTALIPDAHAYGLDIQDVVGDQMLINTAERGPEWIDFFQNAGGQDGAFQWLDLASQGAGGGAPAGGGMSGVQGMPGGNAVFEALMAGDGMGGSDLMARIQAELQKLLSGQAPSTPNAPMPQGGL